MQLQDATFIAKSLSRILQEESSRKYNRNFVESRSKYLLFGLVKGNKKMEDFSYFHYERNLTGNYNEMSNLCWTGR